MDLLEQRPLKWVLLLLAFAGCSRDRGDPPPTCVAVANAVFQRCVSSSDEPCEASVFTVAYEACREQTSSGRSVKVPYTMNDWVLPVEKDAKDDGSR